MKHNTKFQIMAISISLLLIISLFNTGTVFADDATPPAPATEAPTQIPPTQSPTETVLVEPAQPVLTEAPVPEPVFESAESSSILDQIPADTSLVIMVDGEVTPLVTQDAADTIANGDPIWCPAGASPIAGSGGCTASYTSLSSLLADLSAMNGGTGVDANGTIWIQDSYVSSTNDPLATSFSLDGSTLTNWANYSLTLQGGWSGNSTGTISGVSDFSTPILVINWNNDVTVNEVSISNTSSNGLEIVTTGDIRLDNVSSNNNHAGAALYNTQGNGDIVITGTNTFNTNWAGLVAESNGNILLQNITASNNASSGASLNNSTGTAMVTLTGTNSFNNNGSSGLWIISKGDVHLNNITANENGSPSWLGDGLYINNTNFSGGIPLIAGTSGNVTMTGINLFNNNRNYGLEIQSNGFVSLMNITANGNGEDFGVGAYIFTTPSSDNSGNSGFILTGTNSFSNNYSAGLSIQAPNPFIFNTTANNNLGSGIYVVGSSNIYCSSLNGNSGYGIESFTGEPISLNNVVFNGNFLGETNVALAARIQFNCSSAEKAVQISNKPIHEISVSKDQTVFLDCALYSGTLLTLSNGNSAYLPCPIRDAANTTIVDKSDLPALPDGNIFGTGLSLQISTGNQNLTTVEQFMKLSFVIPDDMRNANLAVLYWDGVQWVELTSGLQLENERKVSEGGHISEDGMRFEVSVNFTGLFILVSR